MLNSHALCIFENELQLQQIVNFVSISKTQSRETPTMINSQVLIQEKGYNCNEVKFSFYWHKGKIREFKLEKYIS